MCLTWGEGEKSETWRRANHWAGSSLLAQTRRAVAAGNWSEQLLKSMYYVTLQHGGAFPHEIERLWCTVAANKRNVIPILEFLISRGLQEMNAQVTSASVLSTTVFLHIVGACTLSNTDCPQRARPHARCSGWPEVWCVWQ